ncbi:MAG: hypothetical protein HYT12_03050 [Candidatus Liptonbacteria bacterium]|nr:hypothetical protein [Candidatus Liptonbacteria bacterium]
MHHCKGPEYKDCIPPNFVGTQYAVIHINDVFLIQFRACNFGLCRLTGVRGCFGFAMEYILITEGNLRNFHPVIFSGAPHIADMHDFESNISYCEILRPMDSDAWKNFVTQFANTLLIEKVRGRISRIKEVGALRAEEERRKRG